MPDNRRSGRRLFCAEGKGIGLLKGSAVLRGDAVAVDLTRMGSGNRCRPDTASDVLHMTVARIPTIESADHRNRGCVGRPHPKGRAQPIRRWLRAQGAVQLSMGALGQQPAIGLTEPVTHRGDPSTPSTPPSGST